MGVGPTAGPEHVERVGDADVWSALETVATASGGDRETPFVEAMEDSTGEANLLARTAAGSAGPGREYGAFLRAAESGHQLRVVMISL
jgi:hypothetical protein